VVVATGNGASKKSHRTVDRGGESDDWPIASPTTRAQEKNQIAERTVACRERRTVTPSGAPREKKQRKRELKRFSNACPKKSLP